MEKKSIAKNYIYNLIYQLLTIFLPFVTTPYVSRILGGNNIGIYGYTYSIVTYFVLFASLGVLLYGQREIAYVQDDIKKRTAKFWEIFIIRIIATIIVSIGYIYFFCLHGEYAVYYRIFYLYIIANALDITWLFQGMEKFKKIVIRNLIIKTLSVVIIFVSIKAESDLWKYVIIYSFGELLGNISLWFYVPNYLTRIDIKKIELKKHIKPIFMLFLPQVATQIYTVLDKTMIGNITNDMNLVGFYEQAQKIMRAALVVTTSLGTVMASRNANNFANNKKENIKESMTMSFKFVFFIGIPIVFGVIAIADKFVPWFYGDGYDEVSSILALMCVMIIIIGMSNVTGTQYLIPVKKQKTYIISIVSGCLANVIANFIFIKYYGAIGAVIASIIAEVIILAIQLIRVRKEIEFKRIIKYILRYILCGLFMFVVVKSVTNNMEISIINTVIEVLIGTIVYCLGLFILRDDFFIGMIRKMSDKILVKKV